MSVPDVLGVFGSLESLTSTKDEDWLDRLHHVYTVGLMVVFAVFVAGGQYVGNPIECLKPDKWPDDMDYVHTHCWIRNTYFVSRDEDTLPTHQQVVEDSELTYYQWVPQILILMAALFKAPSVLWRVFNSGSGMNMDKIVKMTEETQLGDAGDREQTVDVIAKYLDRWLMSHRHFRQDILTRFRLNACSKRDGTYLIGLYFLIKLMYVANVIAQFFILDHFMGDWYSAIGFRVLNSLAIPEKPHESKLFPRVTFCNIDIRQSGTNLNKFTAQCVLPINLFNEKIFIFIWYWFVIVSVCSCGNLFFWLWRCFLQRNRIAYVKKYLKMLHEVSTEDDNAMVKEFSNDYLRDDGVFVMRIIARNTNDILLSDIVRHLWQIYKARRREREARRGGKDNPHPNPNHSSHHNDKPEHSRHHGNYPLLDI